MIQPLPVSISSEFPGILIKDLTNLAGSLEISGINNSPTTWAIDLPRLQNVTGQLTFQNLANLEMPYFPRLETVNSVAFYNVAFNSSTIVATFGPQLPTLRSIQSMSFINCPGLTAIGQMPPNYTVDPSANVTPPASVIAMDNNDLNTIDLSGYHNITTDLNIRGGGNLSVLFRDLSRGSLQLSRINNFTADNLRYLLPDSSRQLAINDNVFVNLSLPSLFSVQGTTLQIDRNILLSNLSLPSLKHVSALEIENNTSLQSVNLSALTSVESLDIVGPVNR